MTDKGHGKVNQPVGGMPLCHDIGGKDEHRYSDQGDRGYARHHLLNEDAFGDGHVKGKCHDAGGGKRDHHGEAKYEQYKHHQKDCGSKIHFSVLLTGECLQLRTYLRPGRTDVSPA